MAKLVFLITLALNLCFLTSAQAGRKEYRIQTVERSQLVLTGENLGEEVTAHQSFDVRWEEVIIDTRVIEKVTYLEDASCSPMSNTHWETFYAPHATYSQKLKILSQIKGVGEATAKKIYRYWPFYEPPATWSAFKRLIGELNEVAPGIYARVIENYGYDNKTMLGYRDVCEDLVIIEEVVEEVEVYREYAGTEAYEVDVRVSDVLLFAGEKDIINFSAHKIGPKQSSLTIESRTKNNSYDVVSKIDTSYGESKSYSVDLSARRNKVRPKNNLGANITIENGIVVLNVSLDDFLLNYQEVIGGTLYVNFRVKTEKDCFMCWISKERKTGSVSVDLSNKTVRVRTGYRMASDDEIIYVNYSVQFSGSHVYTGSKSYEKEVKRRLKN